MKGEATLTRSVPFSMEHIKKEEEEEEDEEKEEVARGWMWWPWLPCHFEFLLKILKWNQLYLIHFINVIA